MKTNYRKHGPYWLVALTVIISLLLSACGDTKPSTWDSGTNGQVSSNSAPTGDGQVEGVCDAKGEVTGQILILTDPKQELKSAPVTLTLTGPGTEAKTFTTEADGTYTIKDLDVNEYEIEASLPGGLDGKTIEPRKKYLTVDDCYIETVSMVLLAQGIETPPAPAQTQPQVVYVNNQPHYSVTHDPFFWLWLFDRPHYYGYSYPPVYTTRVYNNNNIIYVPQNRPVPANTNYKYTSYSDSSSSSSTAGVKAAPAPVSKGTTRLGSSGYTRPAVVAKTPASGSSTSKGSTRTGSNNDSSSVPKPGVKTPASSSSNSNSSVPHPGSSSSNSSSSNKSSGSSSASGSKSSSGSSSVPKPSSGGSSSSKSKGSTRPKR